MVETEEREIDGHQYRVTQLTAGEGRSMLVRLLKVLGPSLGRLIDSNEKTVGKSIADAVYELSSNLTDTELKKVCEVFGNYTMVSIEGAEKRLDLSVQELHFAGRYGAMFRWLAFALEVNYRDFIGSLTSVGAKLADDDQNPMASKLKAFRSLSVSGTSGISGG